jgi:type I restriction enzyme R subunit
VEPLGFKAFVVAVDREACALYKQALDRYLPEEYSRVVYTATISKGLINLEKLRERFADLLWGAQAAVAPINLSDDPGRPARIIDHFFDTERRESFVELFKDLQTAYEILSPDPFLRDHLDDYILIVQVYQVVYNYFNPEAERRRIQRELLKKTDTLIREHVEASPVVDTLPLYPINRDIANVVKSDHVSDRVRVTNLYRSLMVHIEQYQQEQPYLISIGEQVEAVIQRLQDRQISVQAALEQLGDLAEEAVTAEAQQAESDLTSGEFALYWVLKGQGVASPEAAARTAHRILAEHPGWPYNAGLERKVRLELYKVLKLPQRVLREQSEMQAEARRASALKETVDNLLRMQRMVAHAV